MDPKRLFANWIPNPHYVAALLVCVLNSAKLQHLRIRPKCKMSQFNKDNVTGSPLGWQNVYPGASYPEIKKSLHKNDSGQWHTNAPIARSSSPVPASTERVEYHLILTTPSSCWCALVPSPGRWQRILGSSTMMVPSISMSLVHLTHLKHLDSWFVETFE